MSYVYLKGARPWSRANLARKLGKANEGMSNRILALLNNREQSNTGWASELQEGRASVTMRNLQVR
jgi:hypothetical protein